MTRTSAPDAPEHPTGLLARLIELVRETLIDQVPRDHDQPDSEFRRRRIVAAVTIVLGTTLLGLSLASSPGTVAFYPLTAGVAIVWVVGSLLSGPLHLGWVRYRGALHRPLVMPVVYGLTSSAVFVVGALIVRQIEPLRSFVQHVLDHAQEGTLWLVFVLALLNGVAEEFFFRGALFAAIGRRHAIPISVVIYSLVTVATGNPMLVFAAVIMGTLFAYQRRASGGILPSAITHVVWSTVMFFALPPLIAK